MYRPLISTIEFVQNELKLDQERKEILAPLINYIQDKVDLKQEVNISFICTHNSRRSHLAQVWAQVAALYFDINDVGCYSGGTEVTAVYPMVVGTLVDQGFSVFAISGGSNPVYAIKYGADLLPIIGFSKRYDSSFNPVDRFAAVMTCSQADGGCPFIIGAEKRIPITYIDPKESDGTPGQKKVYFDKSLEIASEMLYVFSQIKK